MKEQLVGFPGSEYQDRFDRRRWRLFWIEGGTAVFTSSGRKLLFGDTNLRREFGKYKNELETRSGNPEFRRWFKSGGNSDVYTLGDHPIVIKEGQPGKSLWSALDRMDYLHWVCEEFLPPHVRVPDHYGGIFSRRLKIEYLIMEKINDGITVEDVVHNGQLQIDPEIREAVKDTFSEAKVMLDRSIQQQSLEELIGMELLPDWHEGNVLVDFENPKGKVPFTLWIIDQ
ncbi:hypothetical protein CMO96_01125 [Candidatus Woesebacteria bacterium]|nr:hypothetical protein [Candidatus Woesebacteria bacterium]